MEASGVNAFAFMEYDNIQSAALAVKSSHENKHGLHFRVEHKEQPNASRAFHGFSGSPRQNTLHNSQDLLVAFQRGVSMGMSQAAQAQMIAHPIYPQYQFYPAFDPTVTAPNTPAAASGDAPASGPQGLTNGFMGAIAAQYSGSPSTANYGIYAEQQQYMAPNPVVSNYQWPLATGQAEENTASNATRGEN